MRKWIRIAREGEVRGSGLWQPVQGDAMLTDWDRCCREFSLPVAREFPDRGKMTSEFPRFVVEGGWMIDTFHNVGVKISTGDPASLEWCKKQIESLLEQCLIITENGNVET